MVTPLALTSGLARLEVIPEMGGGIARLDVADRPLLRPWNGDEANPFSLALNVLVPFSNRISGGGFTWLGDRHAVTPNLDGEACPIHGDGFQRPWRAERAATGLHLTLDDGRIGPWRYSARQDLTLAPDSLSLNLSMQNTGPVALPFGGGFHPWFPRSPHTRLAFSAEILWHEDDNHLPAGHVPVSEAPGWSFAASRPLPDHWINNAYAGWSGQAVIEQGAHAVSCRISASPALSTAIVFSPDARSDFFCFEPVSHPVDAHNLPGTPGLVALQPGEAMQTSMTLTWTA